MLLRTAPRLLLQFKQAKFLIILLIITKQNKKDALLFKTKMLIKSNLEMLIPLHCCSQKCISRGIYCTAFGYICRYNSTREYLCAAV